MRTPGGTWRFSVALAWLVIIPALLVSAPPPEASAGEKGRVYLPPPGSRVKNPPFPRDGSQFVSMVYTRFLGREPSSSDLAGWGERLGGGLRRSEMILQVMDPEKPFIEELFRGLLGRVPRPGEKNELKTALEAGRSRSEIVQAVLNSGEYRKSLGRPAR